MSWIGHIVKMDKESLVKRIISCSKGWVDRG